MVKETFVIKTCEGIEVVDDSIYAGERISKMGYLENRRQLELKWKIKGGLIKKVFRNLKYK